MVSDEWLTPQQAAEILGCSAQTVRAMLHDGLLSGKKLKGRWRVKVVDVERIKPSDGLIPASSELSRSSPSLEVDPGMIEVSIALSVGAAAIFAILPGLVDVPEGLELLVVLLAGILAFNAAYTALWLLARYCLGGESLLAFTEIWTLLTQPAWSGPYWFLAQTVVLWLLLSLIIGVLHVM
jgi:excisionase family DNA binding protein